MKLVLELKADAINRHWVELEIDPNEDLTERLKQGWACIKEAYLKAPKWKHG